ncbi:MAG: hypothetical protein KKF78_05205 [Candidatus Omnitrophica bacterium]|nr:hypothetical protein [Candidatus Omnitrophota bacterium]MBU1996534.1 hypothetical protein [Candidatus Omnitrophota bacterium]
MISRFIWKYIVKQAARRHGFLDPISLFAQVSRFGQPSEVLAPTELLRATAILHARGLLNAQVIQHNLDWVWPVWINKQFDPREVSFIPRSFSLTHINLTHRNWTVAGLPDVEETPLVDPCGLVTPFGDGWSIDAWVTNKNGNDLIPSRAKDVRQHLDLINNNSILTESSAGDIHLTSRVEMIKINNIPVCRISLAAEGLDDSSLVVSLRPCNPEGVSLVTDIALLKDKPGWQVDKKQLVYFSIMPDTYCFSNFHQGDVYHKLYTPQDSKQYVQCPLEMGSAAAMFQIGENGKREITVEIPLREKTSVLLDSKTSANDWADCLKDAVQVKIPNSHFQFLFDASLRTVLIHTAKDVYAGPYTYKRFWFRDAVFITYALLCCGFHKRSENIIDQFERRQKMNGYFESQEGEWDSNGQVLWLIQKYCQMTGKKPKTEWKNMILKGIKWILKKRLSADTNDLHAGLMPSGFSAEHFGPNNYYYWDNFWSLGGMKAAAYLLAEYGDEEYTKRLLEEIKQFSKCIEESLNKVENTIKSLAMPSSPYRRLDSASIGSLAAGYPLQLWESNNLRLCATNKYLYENCLVHKGLFHDMSHSGINPYLTLHMAQVFLRAGDAKYFQLMKSIAELASPTGQWPEAIHPQTKGGCMGDGQHTWAAAEWVMMLRSCFLREEGEGKLILCSGLPLEWTETDQELSFGPAPTIFGIIFLKLKKTGNEILVEWQADWHKDAPTIEVSFPGMASVPVPDNEQQVVIRLS